MIPMKENELYTERVAAVALGSTLSPVWWPVFMGSDIANIERKMRGMETRFFVPLLN